MSLRSLSLLACVSALALATGCAVREERVVYQQPAPAPVARPVPVYAEYGRVERVGYIQVSQRPSGAGAVLGAVIGGVVGHQFGGGGGKALATGAGVIGGAIAGNAIEGRQRRDDEVYRVTVRFDNGSMRDFDFQRIDDLRTGDRVKFEGGQLHRL
ncbi:MAG: glycine zipper 2TM domain-containing protein [Burkholderiales bacterium]